MSAKRIYLLTLIFSVKLFIPAYACLNDGEELPTFEKDGLHLLLLTDVMPRLQFHNTSHPQASYADDPMGWNEFCIYLLRAGKVQTALKHLEALQKIDTSEYLYTINLGTAYELAGNPGKALYYIRKAMTLDSFSHLRSEWLHTALLESQLRVNPSPQTSVAGGYGLLYSPLTQMPKSKYFSSHQELGLHLLYQLNERLFFVREHNYAVAQWLILLADLQQAAAFEKNEPTLALTSLGLYYWAANYWPEYLPLIRKRMSKVLADNNLKVAVKLLAEAEVLLYNFWIGAELIKPSEFIGDKKFPTNEYNEAIIEAQDLYSNYSENQLNAQEETRRKYLPKQLELEDFLTAIILFIPGIAFFLLLFLFNKRNKRMEWTQVASQHKTLDPKPDTSARTDEQ